MLEKVRKDSFFKYVEVDGEGSIEEIHLNLVKKLNI
jgi:hypothetical protein